MCVEDDAEEEPQRTPLPVRHTGRWKDLIIYPPTGETTCREAASDEEKELQKVIKRRRTDPQTLTFINAQLLEAEAHVCGFPPGGQ